MFCRFCFIAKYYGALYLDWDDFRMQSIFKNEMELMEKPAWVHTFL